MMRFQSACFPRRLHTVISNAASNIVQLMTRKSVQKLQSIATSEMTAGFAALLGDKKARLQGSICCTSAWVKRLRMQTSLYGEIR
jgi:uncharacterized protein (DUF342 family)